ncbi:MAG: hypothetical protein WD928_05135 [Gammaproteobacteria bacterium]
MVAYSFQRQFVPPILAGTKCQTVRSERKRNPHAGEELQLYTGLRTRHCRLIKRVRCSEWWRITILFDDNDPEGEGIILPGFGYEGGLEGFARNDGFQSWAELKAFWRKHHPGKDEFTGLLICWEDLQ